MPEYNYDVFISYRRNNLIQPWVSNYFLDYFKSWLEEKLRVLGEPPPRVFFDQINNEPGMPWPQNLKKAIKTSKVLVSVCTPSYFYSNWCKSEWESFGERERILGINGLRIPVRHNDCEEFLRDIQWSDFYGYTFLARDFYQTAQATIFEKKVEDLAEYVAKAIHQAPPFNDDWPTLDIPSSPQNIPMLRL